MSKDKIKAGKKKADPKAGKRDRNKAPPSVAAVVAPAPVEHVEGEVSADFSSYDKYREKARGIVEGAGQPAQWDLGEPIHSLQYVEGDTHVGLPLSEFMGIHRMMIGIARDTALKNLVDPICNDHEMLVAVHPHALNMMKDIVASVADDELAPDVKKFLKDKYIRKPPFERIGGGPPPGGRPKP